jgi:hypothetical protein
MFTLDEILSEVGDDKAAIIRAAIDAEKTRGIEASRKKGTEVSKWMESANKLRDSLRELELDPDADLSPQIATVKEKIAKATSAHAPNGEIAKLQKTVDDLLKKSAQAEERERAAQQKLSQATLTDHLRKAFGDSVYGADAQIKLMVLEGRAKLTDDGKAVIVDGDNELDIAAGVEAFKKSHPEIVKNTATPGGGSSAGSGGKPQGKTITAAQFDAMSAKERAVYFQANPDATVAP